MSWSTVFAAALWWAGGAAGLRAAEARGLSNTARAQIRALVEEKSSWTPAQRKMESHLIHALKKSRGQAFAAGAPRLELEVIVQPDGRVLVDINARVTPDLLALLAQAGGQVVSSFPQFNAIRAFLPLGQLETVAGLPQVVSLRRADQRRTNTGSVDSEGDVTHGAVAARSSFSVTGTGVKVGVLSDGVDQLANSQASGNLGTVTVLPGQGGVANAVEGTAMLEIIHDLAPGAALYFATGDGGVATMAQNILNLRSSGCDIILDDLAYFNESPFQDATIAQAVNTVTASGALYFSAAGNAGNLDSGTSSTWEGDFVDGGPTGLAIPEAGEVHNFGPATYNTVISAGSVGEVDLFWSDPLGGSGNDYDLFVLDSTGTSVLRDSMSSQTGTQDPYESVSALNVGEQIVIVKYSGAARFLHLSTAGSRLSIATSGAVVGHPAAVAAFAVAAVDVATASPSLFAGGSANPVETYSADGPRHVFFNADGSPITPGNFSSTGGAIRQKPDLAAADGVSTSVPGYAPFFGTSAAAPHAAAIAALLKSYNHSLTPSELRGVLTSSALSIMAPGVNRNSGFGLVMATAALQAAPSNSLFILPGAGSTVTGPPGGPFSATVMALSLTNHGAGLLSWSLVNTSAWLNVSPGSGTLTAGGPATRVSVYLNSAASNLAVGSYSATLQFTNLTSHVGQTRSFTLSVTAPAGTSPYAYNLLSLNPLAYWRLNETNPPPPANVATNAGSSGAVATGLGFQAVLKHQPGIVGTSYRFSNPALTVTYFGSHVDVPFNAAFNPNGPFTVEFWAKPTQLTTDLFSPACSLDLSQNSGNSRSGWIFYQASNNVWQFRVGGVSGYVATLSGGTVQTSAWQHVAGVYDGAKASLYVNGQLAAGPSNASGFGPNTFAALRFGATTIPNRTFDGWVDEPAFFARALPGSEIAAHHAAAATNNAGYASQILASHPLGYWQFDEPAYTTPAQSALPAAINLGSLAPFGNGLYEPGASPGVPGVPDAGFGSNNYACQFASTSYVDVPGAYLNVVGPLSLSAWVKANPATGLPQTIVGKGGASYRLSMDGAGHPHFADGTQPGGDVVAPTRIDDGLWHHLVGVYDATNSEFLYIDGQLAASAASANTSVTGNPNDLWIGADSDSGAFQLFNGVVDEVALFTNVLSAAQVRQIFQSMTNAPSSAAPVLQTVVRTTNAVVLGWSAIPGRTYQVQFNQALNPATWTDLIKVTAIQATAATSTPAASDPQKFYRVIMLP